MNNKDFWKQIDTALDRIEAEKPDTFAGVKAILDEHGNPEHTEHGNGAFFAGSGGDRTLRGALDKAGWRCIWSEASYHYVMQHPLTAALLTYVEGDVYSGGTR